MTDKTAPRVTIIHHPDVRRMLMMQKAYAEGMRALVLYTASWQDAVQMAKAEGGTEPGTAGDLAVRVNDLLLPVVKGVGSERAYELLTLSLQTYDSLYEGTTAIQGMDLFFRKTLRDQGIALGAVLGEIKEFAASEAGNGRLKTERTALSAAVADVEAIVASMSGYALASLEQPTEVYKAGLNSTRLLMALGDLLIGWLLARQAEVALRALDQGAGRDEAFYQGKVATARFFAQTVLPRLTVERQIAETTTLDLMELPEEAF
jgi:hypothetical protein